MTNWAAVSAICSILGALGTIAAVIFFGGKVVERVHQNTEDIRDVKKVQGDHATKISALEEWKSSFPTNRHWE
jgi:hypothetical protein